MNEQQLLAFLTVSRTLNFSAAARELYCTQPALSYQIRSLEKELGLTLFERSTTQVMPTEAGRALLPHARELYRSILNTYTSLKGFTEARRLTLRLPKLLLQRDPIYPVLIAALHDALPGYEWNVDTRLPSSNLHQLLCTEADAVICPAFFQPPPEVLHTPIARNTLYLVLAERHPLAGREELTLRDLAGQKIYYEPLYRPMVERVCSQQSAVLSTPQWIQREGYEGVYPEMLAGQAMFLYSMKYPSFTDAQYLPLRLSQPLPDTCVFTLRDDPRPEIDALRQVFAQVYHAHGYL